jgi:hypothetical protein
LTQNAKQLRTTLRNAETSVRTRSRTDELSQTGVTLGAPQELTGPEFLALLEEDDDCHTRPTIGVTVDYDDSSPYTRPDVEDALAEYLEAAALGEWMGGGQGSIGQRRFFDMTFAVTDLAVAAPAILVKLRELGVAPNAVLTTSDGVRIKP